MLIEKRYTEAKLLFTRYGGSHFHMARDTVYDCYRSFDVPKEMEDAWRREMKRSYLCRLREECDEREIGMLFSRICDILEYDKDVNGMSSMIEYARNNQSWLDTLTNVKIAEIVLNVVANFEINYRYSMIKKALDLLRALKEADFRIAEGYKEDGQIPEYATRDRIYERINSDISYWSERLIQE